MKPVIPSKLRPGDTVRIIAPSGSMNSMRWITPKVQRQGEKVLAGLGLLVTYGKHVRELDDFGSSSIKSRLADLHDAFADPSVKLVLCARGGFNVNQLLQSIDYALIRKNPKILCGFSDITALATAIYAKTGLVTYSGPNFSTFCKPFLLPFTVDHFRRCFFEETSITLIASLKIKDNVSKSTSRNTGHWILQQGKATGRLIGGNLCTLNLLQGTEFFPDLRGSILFVEDDFESQPHHFDAHLQSIMLQRGFEEVRGIVIGRFEKPSRMTRALLEQIIASKKGLRGMPIVANVDFGHTLPIITFPIGGECALHATGENATIEIRRH